MPTLKDAVLATLFITIFSALMMLGVAQLDSSAWAEGVRAEYSTETTSGEAKGGDAEDGFEGMSGPLMIVLGAVASALKISLLMGIPGLITIAVRRRQSRSANQSPAGTAAS